MHTSLVMTRLILFLCLLSTSVFGQGFSFRDIAWVGLVSTPVSGGGNDPVFNTLTHYWPMTESAGNARVDTKGGINLAETGGTVNSASGIHGNAANYNTAGHYLVAASALGESGLSAAVWVNFRTLPSSGTKSAVIDFGGVISVWVDSSGNANYCAAGLGNSDDITVSQSLGSLNAWHLIIVTSNGTDEEKISVDGATLSSPSDAQGGVFQDIISIGDPSGALVPDALIGPTMLFSSTLTQGNVTTLNTPVWYSP